MRLRDSLREIGHKFLNFYKLPNRSADAEVDQQEEEQPDSVSQESADDSVDNQRTAGFADNEDSIATTEPSGHDSEDDQSEEEFDRLEEKRKKNIKRAQEAFEKEDRVLKHNFIPHAIVLSERLVPNGIVNFAMGGGARHQIINFPKRSLFRWREVPPKKYSAYVRRRVPKEIILMGKTIGYVVNYAYHYAIEYDLNGNRDC